MKREKVMSLGDGTDKIRKKLEKKEKDIISLGLDLNNKSIREKLLVIAHYYHLLQNLGDDTRATKINFDYYWSLARDKIQRAKESEHRLHEIAQSCLIEQHIKAWNLAQYYYEKGSKILCQMMVTVMDYIIQETTDGASILYLDKDRSSYFQLIDEIAVLNRDYEECYYFLCVYDFCTEKIAEYTGINEYRQLNKEHVRIDKNGLPKKVMDSINMLREIAGSSKKDYFIDIDNVINLKPLYVDKLLAECYSKAVQEYQDEAKAMTFFSSLVIKVDEYYESYMKE